MTKRLVRPVDLENLALSNAVFKEAHDRLASCQQRLAVGEGLDDGEGEAAFAGFLDAAVTLYTNANTIVRLARADGDDGTRKRLIVP